MVVLVLVLVLSVGAGERGVNQADVMLGSFVRREGERVSARARTRFCGEVFDFVFLGALIV